MRYFYTLLSVFMVARLFAATQPPKEGNTYKVSTASHLEWISQQSKTNSFEGSIISIEQNIDLGETSNWTPIGSIDKPFEGQVIGNCNVIQNLNINYVAATEGMGLFSVLGEKADISDLAIAKGKIFLDKKQYVGAIAGINRGNIQRCFSLEEILVDETDYVGGLVGLNEGSISYCYQAGFISSAREYVGGLVGLNRGKVANSYCIGLTVGKGANIGAVAGGTETGSQFSNVYFDQQMCRQKAGVSDIDGVIGIELTTDMFSIFKDQRAWKTTKDYYPQLPCFADKQPDFSGVSVTPLLLYTDKPPFDRAEKMIRGFQAVTSLGQKFSSPDNEVVEISNNASGSVHRPCSNRDIVLTINLNGALRGVLVQVPGYDAFNAGYVGGEHTFCNGEKVKITKVLENYRDASGGKNDDQEDFPYIYTLTRYQLFDRNNDGEYEDTVYLDKIVLNYTDYHKYQIDTYHDGRFMYIRDVHDQKCQLDNVRSDGRFFINVYSDFNPGALDTKVDTIYGIPKDTIVKSEMDATGGKGPYWYRWFMTKTDIDYVSGDTINQDEEKEIIPSDFYASELPLSFTETGEYTYTRKAMDQTCAGSHQLSRGEKKFVVFEVLNAGSIAEQTITTCTLPLDEKIGETAKPTGGNGRYQYRWLLNGEPLANSNQPTLSLSDLSLTYSSENTLTREVKDDTGLMDWTASGGEVKLIVYKQFAVGAIKSANENICLKPQENTVVFNGTETAVASGEGTVSYRWVLFKESAGTLTELTQIEGGQKSVTYTCDLTNTTIFELPVTLVLKRQVKSAECNNRWMNSEGEVRKTIGREIDEQRTVVVCGTSLPYTFTYTYTDGKEQNITFRTEGERIVMHDKTSNGCRYDVTLVCQLFDVPVVEVEPLGALCQEDSIIHLNYNVLHGKVDHYRLWFDSVAVSVGMTAIEDTLYYKNEIPIPAVKMPLGEYTAYLQLYEINDTTGCEVKTDTLSFSMNLAGYVHQKWSDVLYVDNNDKNGWPDAETDLKYATYQWYKDDILLEGQTDQTYYEEGGLNGVYFVVLTDTDGRQYRSCNVVVRPAADLESVLTDAQIIAIYNLQGMRLDYLPATQGIYILQYRTAKGNLFTRKMIQL